MLPSVICNNDLARKRQMPPLTPSNYSIKLIPFLPIPHQHSTIAKLEIASDYEDYYDSGHYRC